MGKTLYLECNTGISGDMTVAALLDLGADQEALKKALAGIPADGFEIAISRVKKSGIDCMDFDVILDKEHENHDHDMDYLYGHEHREGDHDHDHSHHHDHEHHDHGHHHAHRGLAEIENIIDASHLTPRAEGLAKKIFHIIAEAEAKAHGIDISQVHFHEVGAIDSIVDVIAVAVCFDLLDIDNVIIPKLTEGCGSVRCQHGILSVPVPATVNIVSKYEIPMELTNMKGEMVTPTGAAIAAAVRTDDRLPEKVLIRRVGLGAGKRKHERDGILRAMLIDATE